MVKTKFDHLTFVVKDKEKTISFFENVLGFKPLLSFEIGGGMACAFNIGDTLPVLLVGWAPADGKGMFPDFLNKQGSGLHHIGFQVDSLDNFKKVMEDHGIKIPKWEAEGDKAVRDEVLIGTRYAPTVLQMMQLKRPPTNPDEWNAIEREYMLGAVLKDEAVKAVRPLEAKIAGVDHVTFAVKDREKTCSFFEDVIGGKYLFTLKGEDSLTSCFSFGDVLPVFCFAWAPVEGKGMVSGFLNKQGPGLHHLGFQVDSLANLKKIMKEHGVEDCRCEKGGDAAAKDEIVIGPEYASTVLRINQHKPGLTKLAEWVQREKDYHRGNILEEHWKKISL
jgi:catechol 2,3-dioxygenase-like lactoylglutathione lyase family enzyme